MKLFATLAIYSAIFTACQTKSEEKSSNTNASRFEEIFMPEEVCKGELHGDYDDDSGLCTCHRRRLKDGEICQETIENCRPDTLALEKAKCEQRKGDFVKDSEGCRGACFCGADTQRTMGPRTEITDWSGWPAGATCSQSVINFELIGRAHRPSPSDTIDLQAKDACHRIGGMYTRTRRGVGDCLCREDIISGNHQLQPGEKCVNNRTVPDN